MKRLFLLFYIMLSIKGVLLAKLVYLCTNDIGSVLIILCDHTEEACDGLHILFLKSSGSYSRCSYTNARRNERLLGVIGDSILIDGDANCWR